MRKQGYAILPLEQCGAVRIDVDGGRYWCYLCTGGWSYSKYEEPLTIDLWDELAEHLWAEHEAQER